MRKNRKFYVLLTVLCAAALFLLPLVARPTDQPISAVGGTPAAFPPHGTASPAANVATEKTTTTTGSTSADAAAVEALKKETFTVLHADGKTKSDISCRDFLIYNLAAEMLPSFETEALKAQTVASYTYFCYEREREKENPQKSLCGADFADTPVPYPDGYTAAYWKKKWGDDTFAVAYKKLAAAVDAVAGVKILYNGKPILAAYHAVSPGKTEVAETVWASALPYLRSVDSAADKNAPDYITTVRLTADEFRKALTDVEGLSLTGDPKTWVTPDPTCSAAGTVLKLTVGSVALTGKECRTRFGLRSACFTVAYENGGFNFTVKGSGHGVGLSQYGAQYAALDGAAYTEILHRYYTDVVIK